MPIRREDLPSDPDHLARLVLALDAENEKLKGMIEALKGMAFGARSEKRAVLDPDQIALDLGDLAGAATPAANDNHDAEAATTKVVRRQRHRPARNIGALPRHLPRCEEVIEPETTVCPCCSGPLHRIGQDENEVLDIIPATLQVRRIIRPKYACRACEGAVVQANARPRLVERGMPSTALVAHIAVSKFAWHLPLYRQAQILAGYGVELDRSTLALWIKKAAWWLKPLYELLLRIIHAQPRIFCDETPLPVIDPGRGRTKVCQFWSHAIDDRAWQGPAPPAVAYVFAGSRSKAEIETQLASFCGILQVDGYGAYKALVRNKTAKRIRLSFCLAHARRKFVAVFKATSSPVAQEVLDRIGAVYAIEARIRGQDADTRRAIRQAETTPIMEALKVRLTAVIAEVSAKSTLAAAIKYTLAHWEGLTMFLEDGRLEVDTNIVERSMRPIALGRKNALFAGNQGGAESWAVLASLINTAKLNGLDPYHWLADALQRIVSGDTKVNALAGLLPWIWKAERERSAAA